MNPINHLKFNFRYSAYRPVLGADEQTTWVQVRLDDKALLLSGQMGTVVLATKEALNIGDAVRDLRDQKGNEILVSSGEAYEMYVHDATPQLDPNGTLVGWRQVLKRTIPKNYMQALNDRLDNIIANV